MPLFRLFDAGGARVVSVYRQNQSADWVYVQHSGTYNRTTGKSPLRNGFRSTCESLSAGGTAGATIELRVNGQVRLSVTSGSLAPVEDRPDRQRHQGSAFRGRRRRHLSATRAASPRHRCLLRHRHRHRHLRPAIPCSSARATSRRATAGDEATAALLDGIAGTVFTLGDNVYRPARRRVQRLLRAVLGRHKARTRPAAGNHEYDTAARRATSPTSAPRPGPRQGLLQLRPGRLARHRAQQQLRVRRWLRRRLGAGAVAARRPGGAPGDAARSPTGTTRASARAPSTATTRRCSRSGRRSTSAGADVVLNGHDHDYERFAPQDPGGKADPSTASASSWSAPAARPLPARHAAAEQRGAQRRHLRRAQADAAPASYDWQFMPEAGKTFTDSGNGAVTERRRRRLPRLPRHRRHRRRHLHRLRRRSHQPDG